MNVLNMSIIFLVILKNISRESNVIHGSRLFGWAWVEEFGYQNG